MQQEADTVHADQAAGLTLSQSFTKQAQKVDPGLYPLPADGPDFDGTVQIVGDSLVFVVPTADVGTAGFWDAFWKKFVTGLVGTAVAVLAGGACLLFFNVGAPAAGPVCGAVAGGLAAGVGEIFNAWLDGKRIDADVAGAAIGSAFWGAVGGAFGGALMQWASARSAALITDAQITVKRWAATITNLRDPLNYVADLLNGNMNASLLNRLRQLQRGVGGGQVIAVPSYINPAGSKDAWDTLVASSPDKVGVVVANVLNGPGSEPVSAWTDVINRAHAAGKRVLGYVDTGYLGQTGMLTRLGSTSVADWVAQAEQDINAWYAMYGGSIDGIFFDDGYNQCGAGNQFPDVYETIDQYEKIHHPGALTVLNPGAVVPQCYEYAADVLLTFEGSYDTYESSAYQALDWTPADPMKIWHIIYGVPTDKVSLVDETSQTRGAGYVYITDDVETNPYDTLPSYFSAEQAAVPGGTPDIADAQPYAAGAALPTSPSALAVTRSDYTSATLSWAPGGNVANYLISVNGQVAVSLPASMTTATIGGLKPGGTSYTISVAAQGAGGDVSGPSNSVGVTTMSLPGGQTIANVKITRGPGTVTYSADFLAPYSFRRVEISPPNPTGLADLYWWPNGNTESCWFPGLNDEQLYYDGTFCAHWLIENSTLLVYTGTAVGQWSWNTVAAIHPTVNGYNYSWTVPLADLGDAIDFIDVQGEGYDPLTNVIAGHYLVG
jgi:Spherulation-specific family 4